MNRNHVREAQHLAEAPTYWSETIVLPTAVIDSSNTTIVGIETDSRHAANQNFAQSCSSDAINLERPTLRAISDVSPKASSKKKIKPGPEVLKVIRLIQRNLSNDQINTRLPDKSIANIRTIRCRFDKGTYEL